MLVYIIYTPTVSKKQEWQKEKLGFKYANWCLFDQNKNNCNNTIQCGKIAQFCEYRFVHNMGQKNVFFWKMSLIIKAIL